MEQIDYFTIQALLDQNIIKKHPELENRDLRREKAMALIAEVGEMMNELPGEFKFWSNKENDKQKALEEYVDLFHFVLGIGVEMDIEKYEFQEVYEIGERKYFEFNAVDLSISINVERFVFSIIRFLNNMDYTNYFFMVRSFLAIGRSIGFLWSEVEEQYIKKNEINHQRQSENY